MRPGAGEIRFVGHGDRVFAAEQTVVFTNYDTRPDRIHFLPYPVVIAVDVDGEQVDLALEALLGQRVIDVLGRDPALQDLPVESTFINGFAVPLTRKVALVPLW